MSKELVSKPEEIDLLSLFKPILNNIKILLLIPLLVFSSSFFIISNYVEEKYSGSLQISEVSQKNLIPFFWRSHFKNNGDKFNHIELKTDIDKTTIFKDFLFILESNEIKKDFLTIVSPEVFFGEKFAKNLALEKLVTGDYFRIITDKKKKNNLLLSLNYHDEEKIPKFLNLYFNTAVKKFSEAEKETFNLTKKMFIDDLELVTNSRQFTYKQEFNHFLKKLEYTKSLFKDNDYKVADPEIVNINAIDAKVSDLYDLKSIVSMNHKNIPRNQIQFLKNSIDSEYLLPDSYFKSLELRRKIENLNLNEYSFMPVSVDNTYIKTKKISPRTLLISSIASLVTFILLVFFVTVKSILRKAN